MLPTKVRESPSARRIRVPLTGLRAREELAERVERALAAQPGIVEVHASARTGRVALHYTDRSAAHAALQRIPELLAEPVGVGKEPAPARQRRQGEEERRERPPAGRFRRIERGQVRKPAHPAAARGKRGAARAPDAAPPTPREPWHALSPQETLQKLESQPEGLTHAEANRRQREVGPNEIETVTTRSPLRIVADQFANLPSGLLLGTSAASLLLGDYYDAVAIALVGGVNAGVGYRVEAKNEELLASWRRLEAGKATVLRDGEPHEIPSADLVPGDILLVRSGDVVAADARILESERLQCDESSLTGETEPRPKSSDPMPAETPLAERSSVLFKGMPVLSGNGRAVVVATGPHTFLAHLRRMVEEDSASQTPLQSKLDDLGRRATYLGASASVLAAIPLLLRGQPVASVVRGSVALGVAAIPEGLPVVATAALVRSMKRMRNRGMVVRRMSAAETLGGVTVVCADKTGTLTRNEMVLECMDVGRRTLTGPEWPATQPDPLGDSLSLMLAAAVLNSELEFHQDHANEEEDADYQSHQAHHDGNRGGGGEGLRVTGSSTERALYDTLVSSGLDIHPLLRRFPRKTLQERTTERHFVTSMHGDTEGSGGLAFLKGAPEQVVYLCDHLAGYDGSDEEELDDRLREAWVVRNEELAGQGLRVLAIAWRPVGSPEGDPPEGGYTLLGMVGLRDPLREDAVQAVREATAAGIRTVILTGDQQATASAVSRELGLEGEALDGHEICRQVERGERRALERLRGTAVVSRVSPADKVAIVRALRDAGEIVAMAGDGVNDAPALKAADVGIAVGAGASDLARQTADVVLEHAELRAILAAVGEGRIVQHNLRWTIRFLFATNLSEVSLVLGAGVLGHQPLRPLQLLWINLLSDTFPALGLAMEPGEPDVLQRPPASPDEPVLSRQATREVARDGVLMGALGGAAYALGGPTTSFATLTAAQLSYTFACRRPGVPPPPRLLQTVGGAAALQVFALAFPPLRRALHLGAPSLLPWAGFVVGSLMPTVLHRTGARRRRLAPLGAVDHGEDRPIDTER